MPATHRISIHKAWGLYKWNNDWLVDAVSMAEAEGYGDILTTFERRMHFDVVLIRGFTVATLAPNDRKFRNKAVNLYGINGATGLQFLPPWNCLRVDLSTQDSDPGRKYYRSPIPETWQIDGNLVSTVITSLQADINTYLVNTVVLDNIFTPKGNVVTGATVYPRVAMRQMDRRRKKKVT